MQANASRGQVAEATQDGCFFLWDAIERQIHPAPESVNQ